MDGVEKLTRIVLETQQMMFLLLKTGCIDTSKLTKGQKEFFDRTLDKWADEWRQAIKEEEDK